MTWKSLDIFFFVGHKCRIINSLYIIFTLVVIPRTCDMRRDPQERLCTYMYVYYVENSVKRLEGRVGRVMYMYTSTKQPVK